VLKDVWPVKGWVATQSTYSVYKEYRYQGVCPLVGMETRRIVPPPIPPGGAHSPAGERLGEFLFRRLEKKLSPLPTLWVASIEAPKIATAATCFESRGLSKILNRRQKQKKLPIRVLPKNYN
jgi:hypothetical protein